MSKNKIPPDLIAAARDGHLDICEELLKRGASVDVEDRRGEFEAEHNIYILFLLNISTSMVQLFILHCAHSYRAALRSILD